MSSLANAPYISFVVTSRNDNHGGDMTKRMRIFTKGLIHQCNAHKLRSELVFVEWNPLPGEPYLSEVLPEPKDGDYLTIRYIRVPNAIHSTLNFHEPLPIFQMIAKNVGIRRAEAPFVVCTNVDLLFSDALCSFLAKKTLQKGHFYRANRCDIPNTISEEMTVTEQLDFAQTKMTKRLGKNGHDSIFRDSQGVFFKYKALRMFLPLLRISKKLLFSKERILLDQLDLDACGDFTLMSKEDWLDIDGYVELEMYSLHIDSMGLMSAFAKAKEQIVLAPNACTYHIAHPGGWEIDDPIEKLKFFAKFPILEWWSVWQSGIKIIKEKQNFDINTKDWGLSNSQLEEITLNTWKKQ